MPFFEKCYGILTSIDEYVIPFPAAQQIIIRTFDLEVLEAILKYRSYEGRGLTYLLKLIRERMKGPKNALFARTLFMNALLHKSRQLMPTKAEIYLSTKIDRDMICFTCRGLLVTEMVGDIQTAGNFLANHQSDRNQLYRSSCISVVPLGHKLPGSVNRKPTKFIVIMHATLSHAKQHLIIFK